MLPCLSKAPHVVRIFVCYGTRLQVQEHTGACLASANILTEGKTALGTSSPAYPAFTRHVPISRTSAFTSSAHGMRQGELHTFGHQPLNR